MDDISINPGSETMCDLMPLSTVFTLWSHRRPSSSGVLHTETTSPLLLICSLCPLSGSHTSPVWFLLLFSVAGSATHPLEVERAAADAVVNQSLFTERRRLL